ncbi:MAG: hypothetical protein ACI89A_000304 [Porticoccaceae bacterium]|jgi:hypothetical protein
MKYSRLFFSGVMSLSVSSAVAGETKTNVYFGDTHLHTAHSFDAFLNDNDSVFPDTAYRWARGLPVIHPTNRARVQIKTPLDFLVVSDHAEYLGVITELHKDRSQLVDMGLWGNLKRWVQLGIADYLIDTGEAEQLFTYGLPEPAAGSGYDPVADPNGGLMEVAYGDTSSIVGHIWDDIVSAAERHNRPGTFTSLIGWEWSSTPTGANLHRVVFTPDGADKASQFLPYGADISQYPQDLWAWLGSTSERTGSRFVSIPHNSNLSKGYMFGEITIEGNPITAQYAKTRMAYEPVVEVTQIKGDSESLPGSPLDDFADFETYGHYLQAYTTDYQPKPGDYVRSALKTGLSIAEKVGVNPYKFGMIGSTDSHTGLSSAEEDNFWGKYANDSTPETKDQSIIGAANNNGWSMSAAGLAAVWAKENTREEIYAAFKRKEVYATTGPRLRLQVFAGWGFPLGASNSDDISGPGYAYGVPMGGDLTRARATDRPEFLVRAVKDPQGANLDRVQIIKGWIDELGEQQEKVYDVAWSEGRSVDEKGVLSPIGNTVNLKTARHANTIGASELSVLWKDPLFEPDQRAFYYVRVLQIPTARHSLYDSIALQTTVIDSGPATIQERAYSSPVWYTP